VSTASAHPHLTVLPPLPTEPPAPIEGVVVEKTTAIEKPRPSWLGVAVNHAKEHCGYAPWVARGYARLGRDWLDGYRDGWPHMIRTAEHAIATTDDLAKQSEYRQELENRRADYRKHRLLYGGATAVMGAVGAGGLAVGTLSGGLMVDLAALLAGWGYGAWNGRRASLAPAIATGAPAPLSGSAPAPGVRGVDDLITALIKAGIITEAQRAETRIIGGIRPDGPGWSATIELPEGMKAVAATPKGGELASALRKKGLQLEFKPDPSATAHEGMASLWVADSPTPFAGPKVYSQLIDAPRWHFWRDGIPLGMDARQGRQTLNLIWSSMLIGGLQDYGKSYLARLIASAAALDPTVRIIVITGKTGPDWAPLKSIAHRYVAGSDPDTIREIFNLMTSTIEEMQARGTELDRLFEKEPHKVPEGKITPELADSGMGPVLVIVEELQELLDGAAITKMAMPDDDSENPRLVSAKGPLVDLFARFNRLTRYVLGMGVYITQRPDATSVPTELRDVCIKRASFRTKTRNSSEMILGEEAVKAGATPHALLESSKGIFVLDEGAEDGYRTLRGDVIDLPAFAKICDRGQQLRVNAGTLTGDAAKRAERDRRAIQARLLSADCLAVMDAAGTDRIRTEDLLAALGRHDCGSYGRLTSEGLKELLAEAGLGVPVSLGAMGDLKNPRGFKREIFARYA
jgi:S-DNA-T family DNA segregation ATPase FtsK/SpoIIIE